MKNAVVLCVCILLCAVLLPACKKKNPPKEIDMSDIIATKTPEIPTDTPTPTPEPTQIPEGMMRSHLTGEWIEEDYGNQRPFAVMFNNISLASPQSGIGEADILYEALVEAGITRLMAIYDTIYPDSPAAKRLGSIRSARHYFVSIASEYDAIYVHFGGTSYADRKIKSLGTDYLSGTGGYGTSSFYRDNSIKAPHNAFASLDGINTGIERGKMRTELKDDYDNHFSFYEEDTELSGGESAEKITIPFSGSMQPYFEYNTDKKTYTRYQFDKVHTDFNTGEELAFKNIIIQFVKEWDIDKNGYQTMDLEDAKGDGFYITNGKVVPITWKKNESTYFMKYYDMDGTELIINTGKTYIAVFPSHRIEKLEIE